MKLDWKAVLGFAISAFALWWVLRGEDLGAIWAAILGANWGWLFLSVLVGTLGYLIRAMRWHVLLQPVQSDTTFRSRFAAVSIGFALNNVLPMRLGEIARPAALAKVEKAPFTGVLGSLFIERFLDTIALTTFLVLPVLLPSFPAENLEADSTLAVLLRTGFTVIVVLLAFMVLVLLFPKPTIGAAEKVCGLLPDPWGNKVVAALEAFLDSLGFLRDPRLLLSGLAWTFFFWSWHTLSFYFGFLAFGVDASFAAAYFTMAAIGFWVALPAAPGFLGTFQLGAEFALVTTYAVATTPVLAFAFGYHITTMIPITVIGLLYASKIGFSVRSMSGQGEETATPGATAAG